MKTGVRESYWNNGNLWCRYRETEDGKLHGLYELYMSNGSINCLGYYNMGKVVKLANDYHYNIIDIRYHI